MTSSQPTQPLTDVELAEVRSALADLDAVVDGVSGVKGRYGWRLSGVSQHVNMHADLVRLLAEVDRLRAKIVAFLEPHALVHRNIPWTDEGGIFHVTELLVCGHCVPEFTHFNRREDIPEGPCETRRALGLDQDGNGQANV